MYGYPGQGVVAVFVSGPCRFSRQEIEKELAGVTEIIGADGGANHLYRYGIMPDLIFGDMDSIRPEAYAYFKNKVPIQRHPVRKDRSDLELILDYLISPGENKEVSRVLVFGAFGGRPDHVFAHLQLLEKGHTNGITVELISRGQRAYLVTDRLELEGRKGDYVSIFPLTIKAEGIRLSGLGYSASDLVLHRGTTRGLSNYFTGRKAVIELERGKIFVFVTDGRFQHDH